MEDWKNKIQDAVDSVNPQDLISNSSPNPNPMKRKSESQESEMTSKIQKMDDMPTCSKNNDDST